MNYEAVIAYHPKDRDCLPWVLWGLTKYTDATSIKILAARRCEPEIERTGADFIDEDSVIPGLTLDRCDHPRWRWYFQQLIKLGAGDLVSTPYYLVIDADTVLFRRISFFTKQGRPCLTPAAEHHLPYFETFERLMGFRAKREFSFIAHHMMFQTDIVREMRRRFLGGSKWYENVLSVIMRDETQFGGSLFSEFETYGHYLKSEHPNGFVVRPLKWLDVPFPPSESLICRLSRCYDFCSFHTWMRRRLRSSRLSDRIPYILAKEKWFWKNRIRYILEACRLTGNRSANVG